MSSALAAFGIDMSCRCICPLFTNTSTSQVSSLLPPASAGGSSSAGSQDVHRFLLATSSFAGGNKIYFVEYVNNAAGTADDKSGRRGGGAIARSAAVWQVEGEVWDMSCCPNNALEKTLFSTTSSPTLGRGNSSAGGCSIYSLSDIYVSTPSRIASLPSSTRRLCWDPQGLTTEVRAIDGTSVVAHKLAQLSSNAPAPAPAASVNLAASDDVRCVHSVVWSPHHEHVVAAAVDNRLVLVDMRTGQPQQQQVLPGTNGAHGFGSILHVEFSPSSTSTMLSSGEDGYVRLWDSRKTSSSSTVGQKGSSTASHSSSALLSSQKVHDHWCTKATFNSFHDELILTASTDNTCRLWSFPPTLSAVEQQQPRSLSRRLSAQVNKDSAPFLVTSPSVANVSISPSSAFFRKSSQYSLSNNGGQSGQSEGCVVTLSDFGDSVMSCCWSQANDSPWVFAAVSANGKMLVDAVPDEQIQRILLESTSE